MAPDNGVPWPARYNNVNGSDVYGNPVLEIPEEVLESIQRNGVRRKALHAAHGSYFSQSNGSDSNAVMGATCPAAALQMHAWQQGVALHL